MQTEKDLVALVTSDDAIKYKLILQILSIAKEICNRVDKPINITLEI